MSPEEKQEKFYYHVHKENSLIGKMHPDGCFYCGGKHYSDECQETDKIEEYWADE